MSDYDVKAACEERQRRLLVLPHQEWTSVHGSGHAGFCTCTILQAALDAERSWLIDTARELREDNSIPFTVLMRRLDERARGEDDD